MTLLTALPYNDVTRARAQRAREHSNTQDAAHVSPEAPRPLSREVRLILALGQAERIATVRTVAPRRALSQAAVQHSVDPGHVAMLWAEKLIACARAREHVHALPEEEEHHAG